MRVLIVEDDSMFNQFYSMYAQMQSDDYIAVSSLAEARLALINAQGEPFDAVLLDNHLGDGQGLDLIPDISTYSTQAAVVMVSANDEAEFFLSAFERGVDDYAVKPVNMDLLWVKLRRSVQQRRLQRQTVQQQTELEIWIDAEQKEQQLAHHIFSSMTQQLQAETSFFRALVQSSSTFCGDVVLRQRANDGSWYFLLADSMGHGLAAAVSLIPMLDVFQTMSRKALPLSNIVFELNHKLSRQLPDDRFVAAAIMRLDPNRQQIEIWNGAMPPILLVDQTRKRSIQVRSSNMALGILDDRQVEVATVRFPLQDFDYLVAYSDGVIESPDAAGALLTAARIESFWADSTVDGFNVLTGAISRFEQVQDDITACELNLREFCVLNQSIANSSERAGAIDLEYQVRGLSIAATDFGGVILHLLTDAAVPQLICTKAFSIVTELFLNSFEHGVLGLESALKQQDEGFLKYYEEKELRSERLTLDDFVKIAMSWDAALQQLTMTISDSGAGFSHAQTLNQSNEQFHGRGLQLVASLTSALTYNDAGNQVNVVING